MGFFDKLFGRGASGGHVGRITHKNPLIIKSPTIGFLNLIGESALPLIEEDRSALVGFFAGETLSEGEPPTCDVLFVYARVQSDGIVEGSATRLRDIVNRTNASIVVFASENDPQGYIAAGRQSRSRNANLVLTVERQGKAFGTFFSALFGMMKAGVSMPMAWVKLAPQGAKLEREDLPSTIFSAEISHIIFQ